MDLSMNFKIVAVLLGLLGMVSCNGLLVVGTSKRVLATSLSVLKFEIVGSDKDPSKSISKAEATIDKLKKALKGIVQKEDMKVSSPQIEMETTNQGKVAFYETIIQIELVTKTNLGEIISVADKFGTLIDVSYKTSDDERNQLKSQLVDEAFRQAEEKAERYARAIGVELDGVDLIEIHDNIGNNDDPSIVIVEVSVLYNLFNPQDEYGLESHSAVPQSQDLRGTDLIIEDETKFEETNENKEITNHQDVHKEQKKQQEKGDSKKGEKHRKA